MVSPKRFPKAHGDYVPAALVAAKQRVDARTTEPSKKILVSVVTF